MKDKMKDKKLVEEPIGDPAFYNDQIDANKEPMKATMDKKKGKNCKNGL